MQPLQEAPEGAHPTTRPRDAAIVAPEGAEAATLELHGGFYQVFTARGSGAYDSRRAWHAQLTARTPPWRRLRLFGALETAPQSGAVEDPLKLSPWLGGEATLGISVDGIEAGPWSLSPAVAGGVTIALGDDRERIEVEPLQALAGVRLAAGERDADWRIRAYLGYGVREQIAALPPEDCDDCAAATEADLRWAWVADVLMRVPGLPAGASLRVKLVSTQPRDGAPGARQWLVGLVAGVP